MKFNKTIYISRKDADQISKWLSEVGQGESNTYTQTAVFPDGIEADIKCCGCKDEPSWTEMVLFKNGHELCCSDVNDDFIEYADVWTLEWNGSTYTVSVKTEPLCWDCAYVGDSKSFPQSDGKMQYRYYCNCGDTKYYNKDITGKVIDECRCFEEV